MHLFLFFKTAKQINKHAVVKLGKNVSDWGGGWGSLRFLFNINFALLDSADMDSFT